MIQSRHSSAARPDESDQLGQEEADVSTQAPPSRAVLVRWLLAVTRPVLSPLLGSTLCRSVAILSGVTLFSLGAYAAASVGLAMATSAPVPSIWPILAVMAGLSLLKAALRYAGRSSAHSSPAPPGSASPPTRAICCHEPPRTWTASRSSSPTPSPQRSRPPSLRSSCSRSSV